LAERSDEQLVELILNGNDEAFEVLFERHVADSLSYAREVLGSWGEAEEAVRHSFAAAHAYLETRGRETEFLPWLQTILGNHCLSMVQARTPGPGPTRQAEKSNVVDLGEWRLRRKLMGISLPIPAGAGLRESLMAACGIGGGAAAVAGGAPLLGGTLAKLAVVAVLAGGAGVAGNLSPPDWRASATDGTERRAMVEHRATAVSDSPDHSDREWERVRERETPDRSTTNPRQPVSAPPATPAAPVDQVAAEQRAPATSVVGEAPLATQGGGAAAPVELDETRSVKTSTEEALERVGDVVGVDVPAIDDLTESQPLGSTGVPQVVDELDAVASDPAAGIQSLLNRSATPAVE
jgi:hypothetical protein